MYMTPARKHFLLECVAISLVIESLPSQLGRALQVSKVE